MPKWSVYFMGIVWTLLFAAFLIYLGIILVTEIDTMDGWMKALYIIVITAGVATVGYQTRQYFKQKYEMLEE